MLYNAKVFTRALLAQDKYTQLLHLSKLNSGKDYTKSFLRHTKILLDADSNEGGLIVFEEDRKNLEKHEGSLERSHFRYLVRAYGDSEIAELENNAQGVPVYLLKMEYSFGNLMEDRDKVKHLHEQIQAFLAHQGKAIFVCFFAVVNHWITIVIHK